MILKKRLVVIHYQDLIHIRLDLHNGNANREELDAFVKDLNGFYKDRKNIKKLTSVIFIFFEIETGRPYMMNTVANPDRLKKVKLEVKSLNDITLGVKTQNGEEFMYLMNPPQHIQLILSRKFQIDSVTESIAFVLTEKESMAFSFQSNI